jgi:hypothetical protein
LDVSWMTKESFRDILRKPENLLSNGNSKIKGQIPEGNCPCFKAEI